MNLIKKIALVAMTLFLGTGVAIGVGSSMDTVVSNDNIAHAETEFTTFYGQHFYIDIGSCTGWTDAGAKIFVTCSSTKNNADMLWSEQATLIKNTNILEAKFQHSGTFKYIRVIRQDPNNQNNYWNDTGFKTVPNDSPCVIKISSNWNTGTVYGQASLTGGMNGWGDTYFSTYSNNQFVINLSNNVEFKIRFNTDWGYNWNVGLLKYILDGATVSGSDNAKLTSGNGLYLFSFSPLKIKKLQDDNHSFVGGEHVYLDLNTSVVKDKAVNLATDSPIFTLEFYNALDVKKSETIQLSKVEGTSDGYELYEGVVPGSSTTKWHTVTAKRLNPNNTSDVWNSFYTHFEKDDIVDNVKNNAIKFTDWNIGNLHYNVATDNRLDYFSTYLLELTNDICVNHKTNTAESFSDVWSKLGVQFNAMPSSSKSAFQEKNADENGTINEKAVARYKFICSKYGLENFANLTNITSLLNLSITGVKTSLNNFDIILVVVVSSIIVATLLFFVKSKRRKYQ